jgi:hypothetical protein
MVDGLVSKPELNKTLARISGLLTDTGRYPVTMLAVSSLPNSCRERGREGERERERERERE